MSVRPMTMDQQVALLRAALAHIAAKSFDPLAIRAAEGALEATRPGA